MYIRQRPYKTKNGERRYSYSLLECKRIRGAPKQLTVLNLGQDFSVDEADWAQLCEVSRDRLIGKPRLPLHDPALEKSVEDLVTKLKAIEYDPLEDKDVRTPIIVDEVDTEEVLTVGGERVALAALAELGFADLLEEMGLSERYVKIACALVAGRMLSPGSELHTHEWMHTESAILELLELSPCSESTLYRVGDALWEHHEVIMDRLFDTTRSLFGLEETIIFYDLTNTYTYGGDSPLRKHGHSKEKRSDCRLVTLALTLDASGFPRRAEVLPGNASEPGTLKAAIEALNSTEPTVIMDAGLATAANLEYLDAKGLRYLTVMRTKTPPVPEHAPDHQMQTAGGVEVSAWSLDKSDTWHRVYVLSEARKHVSDTLLSKRRAAFEKALQHLHEGLSIPRRLKRFNKVERAVGRLTERYETVAYQYDVSVVQDQNKVNATEVKWTLRDVHDERTRASGGIVLQTSHVDWSLEEVVRTYWRQQDIERTFRSMKSELGLRPIYHRLDNRIEGHIFISILAYHVVHLIRTRLRRIDLHGSWDSLRRQLNKWHRVVEIMPTSSTKGILRAKDQKLKPMWRKIADVMGVATNQYPEKTTVQIAQNRSAN